MSLDGVSESDNYRSEPDVSCWNCFSSEDGDKEVSVQPIPLPKIREEQREKLKLYSFLAAEISRPKVVSLKQKVGDHYGVTKKIDEKIGKKADPVKYKQVAEKHFEKDKNTKSFEGKSKQPETKVKSSILRSMDSQEILRKKLSLQKQKAIESHSTAAAKVSLAMARNKLNQSRSEKNLQPVKPIKRKIIAQIDRTPSSSSAEDVAKYRSSQSFDSSGASANIKSSIENKYPDVETISNSSLLSLSRSQSPASLKHILDTSKDSRLDDSSFSTSKDKEPDEVKVLHKVQIETSTPKENTSSVSSDYEQEKVIKSSNIESSLSNDNEELALKEKADNTSSNGSESGYAGSVATVQDVAENEENNVEKLTEDLQKLSIREQFKTSLPALNKVEKKILKMPSSSVGGDLNLVHKKSPKSIRWSTATLPARAYSVEDDPNSSLVGHVKKSYTLKRNVSNTSPQPSIKITKINDGETISLKSTTKLLLSSEQDASHGPSKEKQFSELSVSESRNDSGNNSNCSTLRTDEVYMSDNLSPGHATLPRRSSSPLPHDADRDRFSLNRSGLQNRSESMASVYSGAGEGLRGSVTVKGEVQFSLLYNYRLGALEVGVKRCRDLAPIDVKRNRSDPYVKVYLLPDKSKAGKRKTKVKKNTLNPVFEETLSFAQPLASLSSRTLWLSVWHADMFGRNDFLGEVSLPLADVVFDDPAPMWYRLHERTEQFDEQQGTRGDIIIGLKFELQETTARGKGTLHVLVKEAKNLVATKPSGLTDVFCKSYLLPERGRLAKQKTGVARRTLNPRWEHTFTYRGLTLQDVASRALELSLWDRDRLASNDFMGAIRLSLGTGTYMGASVNWMDSVGKEVSLWQTMMQRPNFWVEGCLPLRPQLNNNN
ncbi:unnamed protein product [Pieris macdunnoughi]|uniref:C2 domain-containing protein n=1 Tax=Pieris macdunnoughi TaxID=345717 RepID=A0A821PX74_9NEOP|nr:unnamed protein product [Pieris macdunnoughi]